MQNQAALLYRLQQIDLAIARRNTRLQAIADQLSSDETVARATKQLAAAEQAIKPWQTRARDLDLEIKSVAAKAQATNDDLYSGKITSPKGLQELQDEFAALKRQQSGLEDQLLEAMVEVEDHQGKINAAKDDLSAARANLDSTQHDLLDEQQRLEAENADAEGKRAAATAYIAPENLAAYDKLRQRMRGVAVALLQDEGCTVCGVGQTSMVIQQVALGRQLVYCASCGRILADNA